jgi:predicted PurR-regulated permease PerM
MGQNLPNLALAAIVGFVGFIKEIFLGLLIGFYMLIDYDNFSKQLAKVIPFKHKEGIKKLSDNIDVEVRKTVTGTLLLAFIVFLINAIGFVAIGLKGSIILAIVCGIVDLIPFIGPYIGIGAVTVIGFTMSPFIGFAALAISSGVQILENIILRPVIMSKATDLNPVIILSGLLIFAHFWGIIGMIISTPLLAIIKVLYQHFELKIPIMNKINT